MLSSLGLLASPARADQVPVPVGVPAAMVDQDVPKPAFAMMDNTGDGSQVQLDVMTSYLGGNGGSIQLTRPRVAAQYLTQRGIGGYASYSGVGVTGDGVDSTFLFSNLELGALYHQALAPDVDLGIRIGAVIHTGSSNGGDDDALGAIDAIGYAVGRPGDLAVAAPGEWLRFGLSPTARQGMMFERLDLGLDVRVNMDAGHPIGHVNAGIGVGQAKWSATAEFGIVFPLSDDGDPLKVAGLSARYNAGTVSPFLAVSYPFDADGFSNPFNVLAGVSLPLGI